jgi:hypothetical protein
MNIDFSTDLSQNEIHRTASLTEVPLPQSHPLYNT